MRNYVTKQGREHADEVRNFIESLCKLFFDSVSRGNYFEIIERGICGGESVDEYPELAIVILNTLEKCFKILKDENLPTGYRWSDRQSWLSWV